ncbi:MAG: prepilin-type N-terminal cleavage/methylation domain-containing protein [Phycisphaerae bacterium]
MSNITVPARGPAHGGRGGFTLVEVAVATAIIGLGVAALLATIAAGTRSNAAGQKLTQATFLAQEIREWTLRLPFSDPDPGDAGNPPGPDGSDPHVFVDDLDDLMDVTFSPPRDGRGSAISGMDNWSQTITMTWRDPSSLSTIVSPGASNAIYVQVVVSYHSQPVLTTGWLVTRRF